MVQKIQFILLSMVKLGNVVGKNKKLAEKKSGGGGVPPGSVKESYAAALTCSGKSSTLARELNSRIVR